MDPSDKNSISKGYFHMDLCVLSASSSGFGYLRKRARYCNVSRIIASTQKSWLLLMPNVSKVFSVSWLLL